MGIEDNKNIHDFNLTRIDDAVSRQKLYLIDFKDHQIQQKKGFGYLFARLRHVIYSIVDRTGDKNLAIEKQQFQTLFEKNKELLGAQAEQIPKKPLFTDKPYSNSKLIERINIVFQQLNGRENVAGDLLVLHTDFQKRFGEVSIEDGVPMPTLKQLKAAFAMAEPLQGDFDMSTSKTRAAYARAVQTIMLGPAAADLPMPEDDICFTCRELQNLELVETHSEPDAFHWRFMAAYKEGCKNESNQYPKDAADLKPDQKQKIIKTILTLSGVDLHRSQHHCIGSKSFDIIPGMTHEEQIANRLELFSTIRRDFFDRIMGHSTENEKQGEFDAQFMENVSAYNKKFLKEYGFPEDFDTKQCLNMLKEVLTCAGPYKPEEIDLMVDQLKFTEEELAILIPAYQKATGEKSLEKIREQLNLDLALHSLIAFVFTNQKMSMPDALLDKKLSVPFFVAQSEGILKIEFFENAAAVHEIYHIDANSVHQTVSTVYHTLDQGIPGIPNTLRRQLEEVVSLIRSTQVMKVTNLTPSPDGSRKPVLTTTMLANTQVSPLTGGILDDLIANLKKQVQEERDAGRSFE